MKEPLYEVSETTKKKRLVAIQNTLESYKADGHKPSKIIAFWPEHRFDEALEDALQDPTLTERERELLKGFWPKMVEIERKRDEEPLFGVILTFMEDDDLLHIILAPSIAEEMIKLP